MSIRVIKMDMQHAYYLPHPELKSYFGRQVAGSSAVIETQFADHDGFWNVVDRWTAVLKDKLHDDLPGLLEFELHMGEKIGPMSVMKPLAERMDDVKAYYTDVDLPSIPIQEEAVALTCHEWNLGKHLSMLTLEGALENMKLSTNSGSPYFTRRRLVVERELLGRVEYSSNRAYTTTPDGKFVLVASLGWRGQEGGPNPSNVKQRVLWMFPMDVNLQESQVYTPFIRYCQDHNYVPTWLGNDNVDKTMTKLFDTSGDDWLIGTDFTKFDQHFGRAMSSAAASVFASGFKDSAVLEEWISDVFPYKYKIPMCLKWGTFSVGDHGMASGSGGTNADETVAHRCLQHEAALEAGVELNINSMCLGDDGVVSFKGANVDRVLRCYTSHGQDMNAGKQHVSRDDVEFLKRYHSRSYKINGLNVGIYSTLRALGKLRFLERWHDPKIWGRKAVVTRNLSIIENVAHHPLREEFLDLCIEQDPDRLGLDIPGYLDSFAENVKTAMSNGILGYQYTDSLAPKPATSWWVYQALRRRQ